MAKTVLTHVETVQVLMSVQKPMVFVQEHVHLVSKDCNVLLVSEICSIMTLLSFLFLLNYEC